MAGGAVMVMILASGCHHGSTLTASPTAQMVGAPIGATTSTVVGQPVAFNADQARALADRVLIGTLPGFTGERLRHIDYVETTVGRVREVFHSEQSAPLASEPADTTCWVFVAYGEYSYSTIFDLHGGMGRGMTPPKNTTAWAVVVEGDPDAIYGQGNESYDLTPLGTPVLIERGVDSHLDQRRAAPGTEATVYPDDAAFNANEALELTKLALAGSMDPHQIREQDEFRTRSISSLRYVETSAGVVADLYPRIRVGLNEEPGTKTWLFVADGVFDTSSETFARAVVKVVAGFSEIQADVTDENLDLSQYGKVTIVPLSSMPQVAPTATH